MPARKNRSERGSALLEYAFVLIIVLFFIFGIVDFGRALYAYHFVANAAREGTRYAIVRGSNWTAACPDGDQSGACQVSNENIQYYVQTLGTGIGISNPSLISATLTGQPPPNGLSNCNNPDPPVNPGCIAQVQVTYPFKFIFPFLPTSIYTMTSRSQMVVSQ